MSVAQIAGLVAAAAAGLAGAIYIGRVVIQFSRRIGHFLDDWFGEPAREGQPERPGVMSRLARQDLRQARAEQRLARIEAELKPNGGGSIKDQVTRIEQATGADRGA